MNEVPKLIIAEKNVEVILMKFDTLVEIVEILEDEVEALKELKEKLTDALNKHIFTELDFRMEKKDLEILIIELNLYDSADRQLAYINQKVEPEFWKRTEESLNEEILYPMKRELQKDQQA